MVENVEMRGRSWRTFIPVLAMAPAGTIAGHALAYRAQGGGESPAHAYLAATSWTALVMLVMALGWFARRGAGNRPARPPTALLGTQPVLFVLQEVTEHLLGGAELADALGAPAVRWGIGVQLLAAAVVVLLALGARSVGRTMARPRALHRLPAGQSEGSDLRARSEVLLGRGRVAGATSQRGPPASPVAA